MLEIRPFRTDDSSGLSLLMSHWGEDIAPSAAEIQASAAELLGHAGHALLVAVLDGTLVGYVQTSLRHELFFGACLEVDQLLVAEDRRGQGIGRALMARAEQEACRNGLRRVELSSQLWRSRTHVFYESLGYSCCKMSKYYEKRLDADGIDHG